MEHINQNQMSKKLNARLRVNNFSKFIFLLSTLFGLVVLAVLIYRVVFPRNWLDQSRLPDWQTVNTA